MRVKKVEKGTAPLEPSKRRHMSRMKNIVATREGKRNAVRIVFRIQSSPRKSLKMREEKKPAKAPIKTYRRRRAVSNEPRFAGERKPRSAKPRAATAIIASCTPVPTMTEYSIGESDGGRKTSVWTSFQPLSSFASSAVAASLYCAMSELRVRTRIMATMTVRKTTIIVELVMENQWILSSGLPRRYTSHRCDHSVPTSSQAMSNVCTTSVGWSIDI
mmetsp:Transcript_108723/g.316358  ORF Transcript_108723/g.316358 Transcript_108723/m.316358 type:complete len:217 (-) Transcript_108723:807-1457(-)